jgi:hypothetical protein
MRIAIASIVATAIGVVGCTSGDSGDLDEDNDFAPNTADSPGPDWTMVGYGIAYQQVNTGGAIVIAYGGYTAKLSYSAAWATELVDAKLGGVNVGKIYAVQGPRDAGYNAKEIGNSKLRRHLPSIDDGTSPIYVVAHSSGSYVAHELLGQMYRAGESALARIGYADLDGGGSGLSDAIVDEVRAITFVHAHDPTLSSGYSENAGAAEELADDYAPKAQGFEVSVPSTGCLNGKGWCLHDVLITHRPHNHTTYDLADDYTDFDGRPPTIEYLDTLIPE